MAVLVELKDQLSETVLLGLLWTIERGPGGSREKELFLSFNYWAFIINPSMISGPIKYYEWISGLK